MRNPQRIAGALLGIATFWGFAQPGAAPEFDAVEVRVAKPLPPGTEIYYPLNGNGRLNQVRIQGAKGLPQVTPVFGPNCRVILQAATMRQLIQAAYPEVIREEYLAGGPRWVDSDRFDLIAKAAPDTPLDAERRMIRTVLARRFHLQLHTEEKAMPVYALVTGKRAPTLRATAPSADPDGCRPHGMGNDPGGGIHYACHNLTMAQFAEWLPRRASGYVDLPVVDLTGLTGAYDFELDWSPRMPEADSPERMTVFAALERQLGLKLEPRKHPMPTLVIDRVDRTPTEN